MDIAYEFLTFYRKSAISWWNHIGPVEYITILTLVGVLGYLLMLKGSKRVA